jgi:uncharacterized protein YhbP (UPF0306 family)
MQNIMKNGRIAYTMDEQYKNLHSIQGTQMEGIATIIFDKAEAKKAMGMILTKFPSIAEMPPNPNMVAVKVTPTVGYFIDDTEELGRKDMTTF